MAGDLGHLGVLLHSGKKLRQVENVTLLQLSQRRAEKQAQESRGIDFELGTALSRKERMSDMPGRGFAT